MQQKSYFWEYTKRIVPIFMLVGLVGLGLFEFDQNKEFFMNFKSYYFNAYKYTAAYEYEKVKCNIFCKPKAEEKIKYAENIPVLTYHGIISAYPDGSNVSIKDFWEQMLALKRAGWQTISIYDYYDFIYNGKKLPEKSFLLTFDDGRKDAYYPAQPILKALGYKATMYVITDESLYKTTKFYLSKNELLSMKNSGQWDLQPHTKAGHSVYQIDEVSKGHYYSNKLWVASQNRIETDAEYAARINNDLLGAKNDVEKILGSKAISFAVPFGDIGEQGSNYSSAANIFNTDLKKYFPIVFVQFWDGRGYSYNYRNSKTLLNNRIAVQPNWRTNDLIAQLSPGTLKSVTLAEDFKKNIGWRAAWGDLYFINGSMVLKTITISNSGQAYLDGTYNWKDYSVKTNLKLISGTSAKVILRKSDATNQAAVAFYKDKIEIEQNIGGVKKVILGINGTTGIDMNYSDIFITVKGTMLNVVLNGKPVGSVALDPTLSKGGIAYEVWGDQMGTEQVQIKSLNVTEVK